MFSTINLTYCSPIDAHEEGGYKLVKSSITSNIKNKNL
jgi:hypothetical protein